MRYRFEQIVNQLECEQQKIHNFSWFYILLEKMKIRNSITAIKTEFFKLCEEFLLNLKDSKDKIYEYLTYSNSLSSLHLHAANDKYMQKSKSLIESSYQKSKGTLEKLLIDISFIVDAAHQFMTGNERLQLLVKINDSLDVMEVYVDTIKSLLDRLSGIASQANQQEVLHTNEKHINLSPLSKSLAISLVSSGIFAIPASLGLCAINLYASQTIATINAKLFIGAWPALGIAVASLFLASFLMALAVYKFKEYNQINPLAV